MLSYEDSNWNPLETLAEVASSELDELDLESSYLPSDSFAEAPKKRSQPIVKRQGKPTYASMIGSAILSQPMEKAKVNVICDWMAEKYPEDFNLSEQKWQNAVRYNLSIQECFVKENQFYQVEKEKKKRSTNVGKGQFWIIHPDHRVSFEEDPEDGQVWVYNRPAGNEPSKKRKKKDSTDTKKRRMKKETSVQESFQSSFQDLSEHVSLQDDDLPELPELPEIPEDVKKATLDSEIPELPEKFTVFPLPTPTSRPHFSTTPGATKHSPIHTNFSSGVGRGDSLIMSSELFVDDEDAQVDLYQYVDLPSGPSSRHLTPTVKGDSFKPKFTEDRRAILGSLTNLTRKDSESVPNAPLLPRKILPNDETLAPSVSMAAIIEGLLPSTPHGPSPLMSPNVPPKKRGRPGFAFNHFDHGALFLSSPPPASSRLMSAGPESEL